MWLAGVLGLVLGCVPAEAPASRALHELERLAFVPAAPCFLRPFRARANANLSLSRPLVLDLFEVTRDDIDHYYRRFAPDASRPYESFSWSSEQALVRVDKGDWPASLTFAQAEELAGWRGMRLPTAQEWLHVAVGRVGLAWPWGRDQSSVANTVELGLASPAPVGTFENGKSRPFGCYDLVGNVWEWVVDTVPGVLDSSSDFDRDNGRLREDPDRVSVLGGAYDSTRRRTWSWFRLSSGQVELVFHARRVDRQTLSPTIGARMCADAESYLWEHAGAWGSEPDARTRLEAVARRWARDPTARASLRRLLTDLAQRPGAAPALRWLAAGTGADAPSLAGSPR